MTAIPPNIQAAIDSGNMTKKTLLGIGNNIKQYSDKKGEYGTLFDRKNIEKRIQNRNEALGDIMFYQTYQDASGTQIKDAILQDDETGLPIVPDSTGKYKYINGGQLSELYRRHKAFEDRIDTLMEMAVMSDDSCAIILADGKTGNGSRYQELLAPVGAGGDKNLQEGCGLGEEMLKIDARIYVIQSYPANSISQTQALSKLRMIMKCNVPNIKGALTLGTDKAHLDKHTVDNTGV